MGVVAWIIVGLIAGALAKLVTGVRGSGCITTVVIGVVGGLLGGILFRAAGERGLTGFSWRSVLVATVGAIVLLFAYSALTGRGRRRRDRRY
ncbi:MAG: GlsB/YeaQ/YmgE family stress response membrane protein [Actinobacteria bacterium]|nr:GlsB/YeaQ/YmgE family stress response membrane protein [Actinomycetota bacterium]